MRIRFVDIDGINTRYIYEGKGPSIVLLHGSGISADTWVRQVDPLAEHFSVYVPDMIGHGFTDPVDLADETPEPRMVAHLGKLMDQLGVQRYSIAGSSYGALIAALMYFDRPDRVDKLVLVGSASVFEPPEAAREALAAARENASSAMGDPSIESCRRRLANASHRKGAAVDDIVLAQLTSYALPHLFPFYQRYVQNRLDHIDSDVVRVVDRLGAIAVPTLVVSGRQDIRAAWQLAVEGAKKIRNARVEILEECGHLPYIEDPEKFNRLVADFLAEA